MIYEFITDKTKGFLTNYLSDLISFDVTDSINENTAIIWLKERQVLNSLKMIEYSVKPIVNVKTFIFGFNGNTFRFYLSKSDTIGLSFDDRMPYTAEFHHFSLYYSGNSINNVKINEIKQSLLSIVREHKLNQII